MAGWCLTYRPRAATDSGMHATILPKERGPVANGYQRYSHAFRRNYTLADQAAEIPARPAVTQSVRSNTDWAEVTLLLS